MAPPYLTLNQNYVQLGLGILTYNVTTAGSYNVAVQASLPTSLPTGAGSGSARDQGLGATGGFPGSAAILQTPGNGQTGLGTAFQNANSLAQATPNLPSTALGQGKTGLGFGGTNNDNATGFSTGYGAGAGGGGEGFVRGDFGPGYGGTGQGFGVGNGYQQPPIDIHSNQTTGAAVSSALRIQVLRNGTPFYTSPAPTPTQSTLSFNIGFTAVVNDVIQVGFASSNASDNAMTANVSLGQGLQATPSAGAESGFQTVLSTQFTQALSQYGDAGNASALNFNYNNPFSVSSWVYVNAPNANAQNTILSKESASPTYTGWYFGWYGFGAMGQLSFALISNASTPTLISCLTQSAVPPAGMSWHMLTVTYDGSHTAAGVTFYMDGVVQAQHTPIDTLGTNATTSTAHVQLAGTTTTSSYSNILVNNPSVWATQLSQSDVTRIYNAGVPLNLLTDAQASNLVAWWYGGSPTDTLTTLYDRTTNGNNITLVNGPVFSSKIP
jgi:hypothetical protein